MSPAVPAGIDPDLVAARARAVRARIEAAGGGDAVRLLAVTKGFGPDAVAAAVEAGLGDLGESYAPELVAKAAAAEAAGTGGAVRWHFIGRLQSNKVRRLRAVVGLWQSVDRLRLVEELARSAPGAEVLVQVNVSGEASKGGCEPTATAGLVAAATGAGLHVGGLMCVGAPGGSEAARPGFRLLRTLADELGLAERSMGMSGDLEAAVAEGSTMVRVGTALFGARPGPRGGDVGLRH
jgi:pyridoxal phosphate enzyme (YggS family)